jgi:hypothetical protein
MFWPRASEGGRKYPKQSLNNPTGNMLENYPTHKLSLKQPRWVVYGFMRESLKAAGDLRPKRSFD